MSPRRRDTAPGPTATASLADALRRQILDGQLKPGQPLREEDLASDTGLSRHTVRSALARLANERLAIAEAYRGVRVTTFADADIVALQQLRAALEAEAVRLLRSRHGNQWPTDILAPVESALARLSRLTSEHPCREGRSEDWPAVAVAHAAVHTALVDAAASPRISEAYARLHSETLLLLVHLRPRYSITDLARAHRHHLLVVQTDGDSAVRAHLDDSTRAILRARHQSA